VTYLLDGNVLVALAVSDHVHHDAAHRWRSAHQDDRFATCPITQGTLLRLLLREGTTAVEASRVLQSISSLAQHEFWPDEIPYTEVRLEGVLGHRQVTDAYLAQLARGRKARLATLDGGLTALHPDVADLVPTT